MPARSSDRHASLAGVGFFILAVVCFLIGGDDEPDADAKTAKVVAYWIKHDDRAMVQAALLAFAALFLLWFAGSLRAALTRADDSDGRLPAVAFAGATIAAVGILIFAGIYFVMGDTAGDVPPAVTQTFSAMNSDFFIPAAAGLALLVFTTGIATLRTRVLPVWLGWASIVLGILSVTPLGFFGFLLSLLWVPLVGILLYMRAAPAADSSGVSPPPPAV